VALENLKGFDVEAEELTFALVLTVLEWTKGNRTVIIILTGISPIPKRMVLVLEIIMAERTDLNKIIIILNDRGEYYFYKTRVRIRSSSSLSRGISCDLDLSDNTSSIEDHGYR
jgi:hypothetical protein